MIKRYESYNDTDVVWEDEEGWLVTYEDHLAIVEKLKAEIERLWNRKVELETLHEPDIDYPE